METALESLITFIVPRIPISLLTSPSAYVVHNVPPPQAEPAIGDDSEERREAMTLTLAQARSFGLALRTRSTDFALDYAVHRCGWDCGVHLSILRHRA